MDHTYFYQSAGECFLFRNIIIGISEKNVVNIVALGMRGVTQALQQSVKWY